MPDIMSQEKRRALMGRIRGKNTTPERYVRDLLSAAGVSFGQHDSSLPGKPDFSFPKQQVVVFVDGDFWHGWRFPIWKHRLSETWREKIETNRTRDRRSHHKLRRMGWRVLRVWEHQIESDVLFCVDRIVRTIGETQVDWKFVEATYASLPPLKRRNRLPKP